MERTDYYAPNRLTVWTWGKGWRLRRFKHDKELGWEFGVRLIRNYEWHRGAPHYVKVPYWYLEVATGRTVWTLSRRAG